jgi:hypothetical protein
MKTNLFLTILLTSTFAYAAGLPNGTFTGQEFRGFGEDAPDCQIEIKDNKARSSLTGSSVFSLIEVQSRVYLGSINDQGLAIEVNRDGSLKSFTSLKVINGRPMPSDDARSCVIGGIR